MKPRLLIIGTAYAIREHRKKLSFLADDFDLTCATANECGGFGWKEKASEEQPKDYRLIGLQVRGDSAAGTRCSYRGLARIFRERRYDVVVVENEPWGVLRWQCWLLKSVFQPRAKFGEFTWENIHRGGWKGLILSAIYRLAAWTSDFVIGGNQGAVSLMIQHGSHADRAVSLPQFGVDPDIFHPLPAGERAGRRSAKGLPPGAFLVAFCGRLVPEKGLADLFTAFALLRQRHPDSRLLIMGTGPLEGDIHGRALADASIAMIPPSTYPEIASFLQLVDLLVLPSRSLQGPRRWWKEQFGHVLIEAMSCGVPAIGSDCGAIPEILGDAPMIFPEGDTAALAELMASFADSPERRCTAGAAQRERVLASFTHERVGKNWAATILRQLRPPTPPG